MYYLCEVVGVLGSKLAAASAWLSPCLSQWSQCTNLGREWTMIKKKKNTLCVCVCVRACVRLPFNTIRVEWVGRQSERFPCQRHRPAVGQDRGVSVEAAQNGANVARANSFIWDSFRNHCSNQSPPWKRMGTFSWVTGTRTRRLGLCSSIFSSIQQVKYTDININLYTTN